MPNIDFIDLDGVSNKLLPSNTLTPIQTHSINITHVITGKEDLTNCDGLYTSIENSFTLGVKTADCAAIAFYNESHYGVIHAGWRGLVDGIVDKTLQMFPKSYFWCSPLLASFEIKRDECYERIYNRFGSRFFSIEKGSGDNRIIFNFKKAIESLLPENAIMDNRVT